MAVQIRNSEQVQLLSADFLPNRFPLNLYGAFSGWALVEVSLPNTTPVTLISDNDNLDVKVVLLYRDAVAVVDGGSYDVTSGELEPGDTGTLYTDSNGTIVLAVASNGAVTIYATGTVTGRVQLEIKWI